MDNEYLKQIYGLLESGATLGTGAVSGLVGLPYGLYKGVTSGAYGTPEAPRIAAREAQQFMERNTYQPRSAEGQANLQQLAGLLEASKLPPVMPEASLLAAIPKQAYAAQAERAGMAAEKAIAPVVTRTMERGGLPAQLLGDLSQGSIRPMDVWHGSPHGPFTNFDPTKIGSGEGAQAFSYGHYLGEARGTGEGYREALSGSGAKLVKATFNDDPELWVAGQLYSEVNPKDIKEGLSILGYQGDADNLINSAKSRLNQEKSAGYLYKVDLPDEAIANMLDWDKPVSKQPNVMKALRSEAEQRVRANKLADIENDIRSSLPAQEIGDDYLSMFLDANVGKNQEIQSQALEKLNKMDLNPLIDKELDSMKPVDMNWNMTGKEFYELLSKREGSPEKASGLLQRQGVPGTRYLDQQSRTPGGSDTSNFVVYPGGENFLTIKEINDKPVGGLLGQSKAASAFDVSRRDASDIFGAGAERVVYKDPQSGGTMEVLAKPDGTASVLSLEVPETSRGKGIGQSLQAQVMQDFPEMMGQVSSKAAAKTAYRLGRRPPFKPDATLEDVYKMMDEDSSVNLVSPEMQKRFRQSLLD